MKKIGIIIAIFCVSLLLVTNLATAATLVVNDHDEANFSSIQDAVNNATSGDTILVYPGTYTENVNLNKELIIMSYSGNPEETIVEVADTRKHIFTVNSNNVTINGFKIIGAATDEHGEDNAGVYLYNKSCILITNNNITGNNLGILAIEADNNTIKNNNITGNSLYGIWLWSSNDSLIESNNIAGPKDHGIFLWEGCYNNTLIGNYISCARIGIGIQQYSPNTTLINNIATGNQDGFFLTRSDNCTFLNNTANSNDYNGMYFAVSKNSLLENNTANGNRQSGFFMHRTVSSSFVRNTVSENQDYGIILSTYSKNNVLECNIVVDNGKGDIHFVEKGNRIINSSFNDKASVDNVTGNSSSDNIQNVPSPGILTTLFLIASACMFLKKK